VSAYGSNYPPGVTGNEYEIAGPDYETEVDGECPVCGKSNVLWEWCVGGNRWIECSNCDHYRELPRLEKSDYDPAL